jgi:hypothetical protein
MVGRGARHADGRDGFEPASLITTEEMAELAELFAPELSRGWIPRRGDLEGGLDVVRRRAAARQGTSQR